MFRKIRTPKGVYTYKFTPIYPGIKPIDKKIAGENLVLLKEVCEKNEINFLLFFGTLLGAVREHDFITHDEDIDLVIKKEEMNNFLSILFDLRIIGFEVARFEKRGFMSIIRNGEYIDLYFFEPYTKNNDLRICAREICKKEFVENTTTYFFLGHSYNVPEKYISFLEYYYGTNWKTPIKAFNFSKSKLAIMKEFVKQYAKFILPEYWVERIQKRGDYIFIEKRIQQINKDNK